MTEARFEYFVLRSFLKKGGARQVREEAVEEFCKIMEEIALEIAKRAVMFAEDEQRLKVTIEDVRNARREYLSLC